MQIYDPKVFTSVYCNNNNIIYTHTCGKHACEYSAQPGTQAFQIS